MWIIYQLNQFISRFFKYLLNFIAILKKTYICQKKINNFRMASLIRIKNTIWKASYSPEAPVHVYILLQKVFQNSFWQFTIRVYLKNVKKNTENKSFNFSDILCFSVLVAIKKKKNESNKNRYPWFLLQVHFMQKKAIKITLFDTHLIVFL